MFDYTRLGSFLLAERKRLHYTLEEASGMICVTSKSLSKIERGLSKPKLETVLRLFDVYGISCEELARFYSRSEETQTMMEIYRNQSD